MKARSVLLWALLLVLIQAIAVAAPGDVIFSDDFSKPLPGWGNLNEEKTIEANHFILKPAPQTWHSTVYAGSSFGDMDMRMLVAQRAGPSDEPGGLIFWAADPNNYYVAHLQADGTFDVARRTRDRWLYPVRAKIRSEVKQGLGQANELRVLTQGNLATVLVNGRQLAQFRGFPPSGGSRIGIYAESGATASTWAFSNLIVCEPLATAGNEKPDPAVLFADSFATLDPAWGEADAVMHLGDHKLVVRPNPENQRCALYTGSLFDDVDVRLKVSQTAGPTDEAGGLVFWAQDAENFCVLVLETSGNLIVGRQVKGKWSSTNTLQVAGAVNKGLGQVNELRVVTRGNKAELYANGKRLVTYTGFPPQGGSKIGYYAESGKNACTWNFSDLVVRSAQ